MRISLKLSETSSPPNFTKKLVCLLAASLIVTVAACQTSRTKIKDVPLPPQAKLFDGWKADSDADDEYVKADKRIQNALGSDARNVESEIYFLDKPSSEDEIIRFYNERLEAEGFERDVDLPPLGMNNLTTRKWKKKTGLLRGEQSIIVAFVGIFGEGERNLLLVYNMDKN